MDIDDSDTDSLETLARRDVTSASLGEVRAESARAAQAAGLDADRAERFAFAVHEAAANAVEHGGGTGELTVIKDDETLLAADITDSGPGMSVPDPLQRPEQDAERGRGLWLSQLMADRMKIDTDPSGTVVHLEMNLGDAPEEPGATA